MGKKLLRKIFIFSFISLLSGVLLLSFTQKAQAAPYDIANCPVQPPYGGCAGMLVPQTNATTPNTQPVAPCPWTCQGWKTASAGGNSLPLGYVITEDSTNNCSVATHRDSSGNLCYVDNSRDKWGDSVVIRATSIGDGGGGGGDNVDPCAYGAGSSSCMQGGGVGAQCISLPYASCSCVYGFTPCQVSDPLPTPTPKCPAAGSNDTKICRNNSLSHSYADGNCGTTTVAIECPGGCTTGSSSCNTPPTCPAAGTVLSQSCEGNNLTETYSTGNYELALGMCGKLSRVITCPSGCPAGGTACNPTPTPTPTTAPLPSTCDPDKSGASNHIITDLDFAWWKDEFLGTKTTKDSDCKQDNIIDIFDFNKMRDLRWPGLLH